LGCGRSAMPIGKGWAIRTGLDLSEKHIFATGIRPLARIPGFTTPLTLSSHGMVTAVPVPEYTIVRGLAAPLSTTASWFPGRERLPDHVFACPMSRQTLGRRPICWASPEGDAGFAPESKPPEIWLPVNEWLARRSRKPEFIPDLGSLLPGGLHLCGAHKEASGVAWAPMTAID